MSTLMHLWSSGSNITSLDIDSQLPSKASPRSCPSAFIIGLPELPPVMSLFERKQVGILPLSMA